MKVERKLRMAAAVAGVVLLATACGEATGSGAVAS